MNNDAVAFFREYRGSNRMRIEDIWGAKNVA